MDLIRSRYIIHGDVQRVGYRDVVQKLAIKNGITGEVRNLEDLEVQIIAEGTREAISHFSNVINIQDFPINVESIETREEPYTGEFRTFKIIRGDTGEEMAERMDTAIQHLTLIGKYSKTAADNSTTLIEMMHTSLDKQDQMLEKQDQMLGKQDDMISLQHETVDEIKGLRKDSKSYLEKEFSEIHKRLHSIENALNDAGIKIH